MFGNTFCNFHFFNFTEAIINKNLQESARINKNQQERAINNKNQQEFLLNLVDYRYVLQSEKAGQVKWAYLRPSSQSCPTGVLSLFAAFDRSTQKQN
jgi:hypothetical protein